jgi:hypothetical protein
VKHVRNTQVLIIDEISMLSAGAFAMVEAVCCEIRGGGRAFGGLQVVLVGDFFQLPPISKPDERQDEQDSLMEPDSRSQFAFASPAWRSLNPIICYLSEQHRQEDAAFLEILSAIRRGEVGEKHKKILEGRRQLAKGAGGAQLFSHNADVNQINDAELAKIPESARVFTMSAQGSEAMVAALKRGCLSPETLVLKIGARVMFTKNDIGARAYVNGTLGVVTGFSAGNGYPVVRTHDGRTLVVEPAEWRIDDNGRTLARIVQIPLRLAWAMTVHKSQGMSLDAAHMDLSQAFEFGQGYVALSRVRTLEGLTLAGLNERALQVHPDIQAQDAVFREQSEAARERFNKFSPEEIAELQERFIKASGGHVEKTPYAPSGGGRQPSRLDKIREKHPNAYRSWSKEEDENLKERFLAGEQGRDLAIAFGRKPSAIRARLIKLGLIEED